MKGVFLDFDGVLFDTLREAYLLCRYAFDGIGYFEPVDVEEYKKLYRFKFLVYNSWQYYYLMKLMREGLSDDELIGRYNSCLKTRDYGSEEEFDKKYYYARKDLMENHHDFWDKLESPFPFLHLLKSFIDKNKIFTPIIVSKKNKKAIEYRLNQYDFNSVIYGKDELAPYKDKADFIAEYMRVNNIKTAYFVDDNSNNLSPCKKYPQIVSLLAGWGNIAIGETGLTCEQVMEIITG